jgi:hypothetical protein
LARAGEPILEVDLHSLSIRRHRLRLRLGPAGLPRPPSNETGSQDPSLSFWRSLDWLGAGTLAVGGGASYPARLKGGAVGDGYVPYSLQIIDTRRWRVLRRVPVVSCRSAFALFLCSASVGGFPPDGKGSRGPTLVVYDQRWKLRYQKPSATLWWDAVAGRLVAGHSDGTALWQLDPETGTIIRRFGPAPLWPLDLLDWRTPR